MSFYFVNLASFGSNPAAFGGLFTQVTQEKPVQINPQQSQQSPQDVPFLRIEGSAAKRFGLNGKVNTTNKGSVGAQVVSQLIAQLPMNLQTFYFSALTASQMNYTGKDLEAKLNLLQTRVEQALSREVSRPNRPQGFIDLDSRA